MTLAVSFSSFWGWLDAVRGWFRRRKRTEKRISKTIDVHGFVLRRVESVIGMLGNVLRKVGTNVDLTGELDKAKTLGLLELLFDEEEDD